MATKVRPLHDRVIVRRLDEEEKSTGASLFLIQPKKNLCKVKSLQQVKARC